MGKFERIVESYYNGQGRQMCEQIDDMGIYEFLYNCENNDIMIDDITQLEILKKYLRIKNR
jgi:hypothetical protein